MVTKINNLQSKKVRKIVKVPKYAKYPRKRFAAMINFTNKTDYDFNVPHCIGPRKGTDHVAHVYEALLYQFIFST